MATYRMHTKETGGLSLPVFASARLVYFAAPV
jgi:hypothetical protein